ncbi:MAG: nucleoside deaminase [Aliiglaciecola sp.]|uniref:nucleoside deaminase n=1 Tax=Aliiglaciecola sp. TaxID=1872441 RepID=UPI00329A3B53
MKKTQRLKLQPLDSLRRRFLQSTAYSAISVGLSPLVLANEGTEQMADSRPSPLGVDPRPEQMLRHLRQANIVAQKAMDSGHHPFGAILVAADNETVLMQQGNLSSVEHAESTLAQRAAKQYSAEELWGMTLYSTAEPCVMCAGTQYWANIGRLVYGISERQLLDLTGNHSENPTLDVPSRYVFDRGQKAIKVWGPIDAVAEEIAALHINFWK